MKPIFTYRDFYPVLSSDNISNYDFEIFFHFFSFLVEPNIFLSTVMFAQSRMPALPSSPDCSSSYGLLNPSAHMVFDAGKSILMSHVQLVVKDHGIVPQYRYRTRDVHANAADCSSKYKRVDEGNINMFTPTIIEIGVIIYLHFLGGAKSRGSLFLYLQTK